MKSEKKIIKIISISNIKYKLNTYLGTDIIKQTLKNHGYDVECISYILNIHSSMYDILRKHELDNGEIVCEIGHLVNFLQLFKNIKDNKENLAEDFTNLNQEQQDLIEKVKYEANSIKLQDNYIISFSIVYTSFLYLSLYAAIIKKRNPNVKIVFGGYHITLSEHVKTFILKSGVADIVVDGDGCEPMLAIAKGEITKGIVSSNFHEEITLPEFSKVERMLKVGNFSCITSVGCTFNCYFCASKREFIMSDLQKIGDYLIKQNKVYPLKIVNFADDCINPTIPRAIEVCNMMKRLPNTTWQAHFVCSQFNDDLLNHLIESGCEKLFLGTEAFSDDILEVINKNCNKKKYLETIHKLCSSGIAVILGIICGMPEETEEKHLETFEVIEDLIEKYGDLITLAPTPIKVFPGSKMYFHPDEFGIKFRYWSEDIINKYWKYNIKNEFPEFIDLIKKIPFTFSIDNIPKKLALERTLKFTQFTEHLNPYSDLKLPLNETIKNTYNFFFDDKK